MRISYREGEALTIAEADKITQSGNLIICRLRTVDADGKPETVARPFPSAELCEQFYREVICANPDAVINLENTNFDPRLQTLLESWDEMDSWGAEG